MCQSRKFSFYSYYILSALASDLIPPHLPYSLLLTTSSSHLWGIFYCVCVCSACVCVPGEEWGRVFAAPQLLFPSSSSLAGFGEMSAASVFQKMGPILGAASVAVRACPQIRGERVRARQPDQSAEHGGRRRRNEGGVKVEESGVEEKKKVAVEEKKVYSTGHMRSDGLQLGHFLLCCRWMRLQVLPPSTAPSPLPTPSPPPTSAPSAQTPRRSSGATLSD